MCHPLGDLGVTYTVHLWLVGKRVVDFLLVLIRLFRQLLRLRRYEWILVEILVFERGLGHFGHKCQGKKGLSTNDSWRQQTRVPGLSRGVVCVILRLAVSIQYWRVTRTHTHTDTRTHRRTMMVNTHASLAPRGLKWTDRLKYLGIQLISNRFFTSDISGVLRKVYGAANSLL